MLQLEFLISDSNDFGIQFRFSLMVKASKEGKSGRLGLVMEFIGKLAPGEAGKIFLSVSQQPHTAISLSRQIRRTLLKSLPIISHKGFHGRITISGKKTIRKKNAV